MKYLPVVAILLFSHLTFAESPPEQSAASPEVKPAEALVQSALLQPLARNERKRSRFTRAALPPQERRVRLLDQAPRQDAQGRPYVRFAVDARHGRRADAPWRLDAITGCVYLEKGEVFVAKGEQFRPAKFLLGKYAKAAGSATCRDG